MPCQNALQKCPLQKVAPKPKLPSKMPCQNSLPKRPTKVAPKPKLPSKMPCQNSLILEKEVR